MKKLNYIIDESNTLVGYTEIPFDETKPYIEVENSIALHVGLDKIINRKLVSAEAIVSKQNRILELKNLLEKSDYLCLKFTDGAISEEEYAPIRLQRQKYRDEINQLEVEITELN